MKIDVESIGLTPEVIENLKEIEEKRKRGEEVDPTTIEALKAIELASNLVDSIMSGRQVDLAFFQRASADIVRRLQGDTPSEPTSRKVKKNRKIYKEK